MRSVRMAGFIVACVLAAGTALATGMLVPTDEKLPPLAVKYLRVGTVIKDGVATTKVEQSFLNSTSRQLEADFVFPLPADAAIKELAMYIDGKRTQAELLDAPAARRIYEDIVRRSRDPALLEAMGGTLYRLRIFPVPANGEQRIDLEYSQALSYDGGLFRYVYPVKIGDRFSTTTEDFALSAMIEASRPITSVYSPSHTVSIDREGERKATVGFEQDRAPLNKDFVLYYAVGDKAFGLNMLAHRPSSEGGSFMLLISPQRDVDRNKIVRKDVVFVLDTSGSMSGDKIEQARRALTFCVNSLNEGDRFNIIQFATTVNAYRNALVEVSADAIKAARDYIAGLEATGGTDINSALAKALEMKPAETTRPFMVVFLTDGKPTIGETDNATILENVGAKNSTAVRLFVFGVGYDVNTHLLDRLAQDNGGVSEYVDPAEDIEVKVSGFYAKASNPVLTNVALVFGDGVRVYDLCPSTMPDLFEGVPLQVFGRYGGTGDVAITLTGEINGEKVSHTYETTFPAEEEENEFVARLWATRRVAALLDEIRLHGENEELVDSIKKLARGYGIVTPYTSYLIVEDSELERAGIRRSYADGSVRRETNRVWGSRTREEAPRGDLGMSDAADEAPTFDYDEKAGAGGPADGHSMETVVDAEIDATVRDVGAHATGKEAVDISRALDTWRKADVDGAGWAVRNIEQRNFYNVDGTWIDGGLRGGLPSLKIKFGSDAYFALLTWRPGLKPFLALGDRLVLVVEDHVLLIGNEGEETLTKEAFEAFLTSTDSD
ncbi:MAG: VWA domain-containing protein [Verrucomicrobia bacterium]|nr:VWA domain-containing protein [Verrucomicrobiota bacterium]